MEVGGPPNDIRGLRGGGCYPRRCADQRCWRGYLSAFSDAVQHGSAESGLEIVERHCHSADTYGGQRYFELGRDAAIEYGWTDLRFRNSLPVALQICVHVSETAVETELRTETPVSLSCRVSVQGVFSDAATLSAQTWRTVTVNDIQQPPEDLGESRYTRWPLSEHA